MCMTGKVRRDMARYLRRSLPDTFAVLAGPNPPDDLGFQTERVQILWNDSGDTWADPGQHYHVESDEIFIVLKGTLEIEVDDERFTLGPGEMCVFPAGVSHAVTKVHPPINHLVIRAPAGEDKVYPGEGRPQ